MKSPAVAGDGRAFFSATLGLLLLCLLAIPGLKRDIWIDEFFTLQTLGAVTEFGLRSAGEIYEYVADRDPVHPPGYFVALNLWGSLVGWSVPALRSFSLFAGLLFLALLYRLARHHFSPSVALSALIFTGFNVASLHMLRDMRTYVLLLLVVTLLLLAWTRLIGARRPGAGSVALFVLATACIPWTHYYGIFAVLALALAHLLLARRHRRFLLVAGCFVCAGLLFLPWAEVLLQGLDKELGGKLTQNYIYFPPLELTRQLLEHFSNGNEALMLVLLALALPAKRARWLWFWTLFGLLFLLAFNHLVPVLAIRYLLFLWPGPGLLAAVGADRLRSFPLAAAILPLVWVLALLWQGAAFTQGPFRDLVQGIRPPFNSVTRQLTGRTLSTDVLVWHRDESHIDFTNEVLPEMFSHATVALPRSRSSSIVGLPHVPGREYEVSRDAAFSGAGRAWLAWEKEQRHWRLGPLTETWLPQQGYRRCNVLDSPREPVRVELWAQMPESGPGTVWRFADDAGREVSLRPGAASPEPSGDGQHYTLFWDSGLPHGYSAGLYRLDANGGLKAQLDVGLEGAHGCHGGTLAGAAAAGDSLWLGVYDWRSGARLTPLDVAGDHNLARIG